MTRARPLRARDHPLRAVDGTEAVRGSDARRREPAILRDVPVPVLNLRGDLPRDLNRIISRCLEKNPRDRFQTARDVYNELRYVRREIESGIAPAGPPSSGPVTPPPSPPAPASSASRSSVQPSSTPAGTKAPSIAVLPFVNRSRGEEDEYFADGLADELLNVLTKIRGLRVAARASSFQFKGKNEDLAVIGEKLNVATLLERAEGGQPGPDLRAAHQGGGPDPALVGDLRPLARRHLRRSGRHRAVGGKGAAHRAPGRSPGLESERDRPGGGRGCGAGHGQDAEAHRLYLQGKYFIDRLTPEDSARGIRYLQEALAIDPSHAGAWVELSRPTPTPGATVGSPSWRDIARGARGREARPGLAPDLAEAHVRLSIIQRLHDYDWEGAEASIRRALELAPAVPMPCARRAPWPICAAGRKRRRP